MTEAQKSSGPGSFSVPRVVIQALLDNKATAYEICTYLCLARFTDASGMYSSASVSAVNRHSGSNKLKDGPTHRALKRLQTIRVKRVEKASNGLSGKSHQMVEKVTDLGPVLFTREDWIAETGEVMPDGPHSRAKILHVLPTFGEDVADRVWFGGNLVTGVEGFDRPLRAVINAGDVAARLLLSLYAANDMETWGAVSPVGDGAGPWVRYAAVSDDVRLWGAAKLHRAKDVGKVATIRKEVTHGADNEAYWSALDALVSAGLIYQVVMVLNRNGEPAKFATSKADYLCIPDDAEPHYELDCRSLHGYKPAGEDGIGWATAKTAGDVGYSVALTGGTFDGTYAAIVPSGYGCMIAGLYRLRFRVSNPRNAGVRGAWAGIKARNMEALELVNAIRKACKKEPLTPPAEAAKAKKAEQAKAEIEDI